MGIHDRDYMRHNRSPQSKNDSADKKLTIYIGVIIAVVVVFFIWKRSQRFEYQNVKGFEQARYEELSKVNAEIAQRNLEARQKAAELQKLEELERNKPIKPLDVNTATLKELINLPLIKEEMARDLISKRPFTKWEELDDVYGIGEKKLDALKLYLHIKENSED